MWGDLGANIRGKGEGRRRMTTSEEQVPFFQQRRRKGLGVPSSRGGDKLVGTLKATSTTLVQAATGEDRLFLDKRKGEANTKKEGFI